MYKVVNYHWNQSLPAIYSTFMEAFKAQQEWDTDAIIEFYDGETRIKVWDKDWEFFSDQILQLINMPVQTKILQ